MPFHPPLRRRNGMNVREARGEEIPRLVDLWTEMWDYHSVFDPYYRKSPLAERVMAAWLGENIDSDRSAVLVAGLDGIVGYVCGVIQENPPVVPDQFFGYVSEIAVTESSRRTGVGDKLLVAIHDWFRGKGMPYVEVNVSVRNAVSRSFWRKNGYKDFLERLRRDL